MTQGFWHFNSKSDSSGAVGNIRSPLKYKHLFLHFFGVQDIGHERACARGERRPSADDAEAELSLDKT